MKDFNHLPQLATCLIFSFLSPQASKNLSVANKKFLDISKGKLIAKNRVDTYFPYLKSDEIIKDLETPQAIAALKKAYKNHYRFWSCYGFWSCYVPGLDSTTNQTERAQALETLRLALWGDFSGFENAKININKETLDGILNTLALATLSPEAYGQNKSAIPINNVFKFAASLGNLALVTFLMCDEAISVYDKGLALIEAAKNNQVEIVKALLEKGNQIDRHDISLAFSLATRNGHFEVCTLSTQFGRLISAKSKGRMLSDAAENGHVKIVNLWLEALTNNNTPPQEIQLYQDLALIGAAKNSHFAVIELLVKSDITANGIQTALEVAKKNNDQKIAEFLETCLVLKQNSSQLEFLNTKKRKRDN